ncbi:E3 ubiquitin-protein ligase TRIM7-like [Heteronotia binoei]|uniref:E3 ubiquitin-protein ligase TRIM7-like n=1 Tax=Heteronotia binoei TaxID=13085 RepID=UPI0029314025|nr:E3 ubiquitin-protein ligase TRIM7-like [Heteronotia binoei]
MAAGDPLHDLCEEASCSICLDFFRDPVMIVECGHNFCRACLTRSWGERSGAAEPSCPQCRGRVQPNSLRPNQQLASFVEIAKRVALQEVGAKGGVREEEEEASLCVVSGPAREEKMKQILCLGFGHQAAVAAGKGRVCQKHQEPLKLFCKDDVALICVVCDRSKEHRDHKVLPLEEASQEYKDQFCNCLEILKKERERIVAYKGDAEKESQDLLKQTQGEKQEAVAKFRQLHVFLEEQEKLLLAQMEEVEMEVVKKRDQHLADLSEALSSLESLIQEMEMKCQQPASDLLQDARSTLQKYEIWELFENPAALPLVLKWDIWDFSCLNTLLEGIKKQFKDTLGFRLHLQKANVTLDPDTAHPRLILSEDQKSVQAGLKTQALPHNPERFDREYIVLGREGFTGGCHSWEVLVRSEEAWAVGVARKSVRRKGTFILNPDEGIWKAGKWGGSYKVSVTGHGCYRLLTVTGELKRIRVCLNYTGGRVSFFDADRAALLYEFSGASFHGETLLPLFWVRGKGHLKISS